LKWEEFRDFALVAMVMLNICLIVLFGHIGNKNTVRIQYLEARQAGLESAVDVGLLQIGRAAAEIRNEAIRLSGIEPPEEGEIANGKDTR
jgi:hypothetical protein